MFFFRLFRSRAMEKYKVMRRTQEQLQEEMVKYKVYQKNNRWYGYKACPECGDNIQYSSIKRFILLRTIRNLEEKRCACNSCNKKGIKNHFFGKKHNKKSVIKMSKNRAGKACGENNAMANPKYRNKVSEILKGKYESGELDFLKKIQKENAIKNQANGKLKTAPISSAEKEIKKKLEELGYSVKAQFQIGSLKYDLLLNELNILIEYNGDYWHCNPKKYDSNYFHKKKKLHAKDIWHHDLLKKIIAEEKGYKLFIIWESDFMFNKEKEINKILSKL